VAFDFEGGETRGWSWFGGGWWVHWGKLRTTPTGGVPGFKALVEGATYGDVKIEAGVTPPAVGDAGVVFRVTRASIGADAYQGYYAGISVDGRVMLGRADGKGWKELKAVARAVPAGAETKLGVTARGNRIEVRVGGEVVISVTDDTWTSGQVGVRMYSTDKDHAVAAFDDVRVTPGG
jgi:hypothetical protein